MRDYTAWLNGQSVGVGTKREVQAIAEKIFHSENWQMFEGPKSNPENYTRSTAVVCQVYCIEKRINIFPGSVIHHGAP